MRQGLKKEVSLLTALAAGGCLLFRKPGWAVGLGLAAGAIRLLPSPKYSFENRSVVIAGGSRGLGLALAEQFLKENACITLLARDANELERAYGSLGEYDTSRIQTIACDVTDATQLSNAFEQVSARFGRLDVLVNVAGSIAVGPFETMTHADFQSQLDLQIHAVASGVRLALPYMRQLGEGRIANISSIGGALPVPHMTTYCAAKFGLAGLSETLAAELATENIAVTTVYPGLMRTGSPIQAVFKGDHEKEYAWFAAGDVTPVVSVSAQYAATRIIEGIRNGDRQVTFPFVTKLGMFTHAIFPETLACMMKTMAWFQPKGESSERKTGAQSRTWLERQFWYQPMKAIQKKAEKRFNQTKKENAEFNLGILHPSEMNA